MVASLHPSWIKFVTYCFLLPLIFIQAAGIRRPISAERLIGLPFGAGIGFLYSVTTISGPPLAVLFNNQGLAKKEFRAALGLIRVAESSMTAIAYYKRAGGRTTSVERTDSQYSGCLTGKKGNGPPRGPADGH